MDCKQVELFYFVVLLLTCLIEITYSQKEYKLKYEYKYSFKGPNLSQTGQGIPFWNTTSDAVPGADQVRVVPSLRAKKGAVWTSNPFPYENWQVNVSFRIHGRGRIGADGFVFWYVEKPNINGPVFGSMDNWRGLGIFFDSFDNDAKQNNPYVSIILNDGTLSYNHANDGSEQLRGGCRKDFRNRPYPVKALITYYDKTLKLSISSGNTHADDYESCAEVNDVELPQGYYFGISAATGGLADDHDILKFLTSSLHLKTPEEDQPEPVDETKQREIDEQKRLEEEYEKSLQEFYADQEKFKEEHPEKVKSPKADPDDLYQGDTSEELRAVFEVQTKISKQIDDLASTVMMVKEKQDHIVSRLEDTRPPQVELAKSHEIENVVKIQRTTYDTVVELQNHLNSLKATALTLSDNVVQLGAAGGAGKNDAGIASKQYESQKTMLNVQERLELMYQGITNLENKAKQPPKLSCPEPETPSCAPLAGLIVVAVIQVIILVAYHSFQQSRSDAAAKKFF